jgi:hypothetical protein
MVSFVNADNVTMNYIFTSGFLLLWLGLPAGLLNDGS